MMDKEEMLKLFKASGFGSVEEKLADNLNNIVEWQEILKQVDIDGVEPMFNTLGDGDLVVQNKDEVIASDNDSVLSNAPETDGNFFLVPKVIKQ